MKKRNRIRGTRGALPALLMLLSLLISCSSGKGSGFYAGEPVSPEDIESIAALLSAEITDRYPLLTGESGEQLCCWTPGGAVYHLSRECFSLSSSKEVIIGTVEEAILAGKTRCCSVCGDIPDPVEVGGTDFDSSNQ